MKKTKTYKMYWVAEVRGCQTVEAYDEDDALDQFNCRPDISDAYDDSRLDAELEETVLEEKGKTK